MDVDSGRILYSKNAHEQKLIASTTKIMTCIVVLENSNLENEITVGEEVLSMYGTNIYLEVGEKIKVNDLLYGLMLRSGNDAAMTLAVNTLGEDSFVQKMNEKSKELGMNDTLFFNPHGLDEETENISSANDMALLSRYAYQNPIYRKIISTKKYSAKSSLKSYVWYNRMSLFSQYEYCVGGKNGYTPKAGKSLVSYAKKNDTLLTIITLDDNDIYYNHKMLYEEYFDNYQKYIIIDKNNFFVPSTYSEDNLYLKRSFSYPLSNREIDEVKTILELFPTHKDNVAGKVIIQLQGKKIGSLDVYAKKKKKKTSFPQSIIDWISGKS